jgi:hypothetical protein
MPGAFYFLGQPGTGLATLPMEGSQAGRVDPFALLPLVFNGVELDGPPWSVTRAGLRFTAVMLTVSLVPGSPLSCLKFLSL